MLTNIGKHCEHPDCHLLDFLPFTCDACKSTFCLDHHKYADHSCKIGRSNKNQECKTCPLCSQVVAIQVCSTADESLAMHVSKGCPQERKRGPKCVQCQKGLLVPMQCSTCHESVCAKHRHPADHECGAKQKQNKKMMMMAVDAKLQVANKLTQGLTLAPATTTTPAAPTATATAPARISVTQATHVQPQARLQPQPLVEASRVQASNNTTSSERPRMSRPNAAAAAAALARAGCEAPSAQRADSPTLASSDEPDTIALSVVVSSSLMSSLPSSSSSLSSSATPCRVYAKRSWDVETAVRALSKRFNVSGEDVCLLMCGCDTAIARELPLDLIADEIQGTTLVLDRHTRTRDAGVGAVTSRAVKAN